MKENQVLLFGVLCVCGGVFAFGLFLFFYNRVSCKAAQFHVMAARWSSFASILHGSSLARRKPHSARLRAASAPLFTSREWFVELDEWI